uniref:hypothetical protein n=1 Tax=Polyopes affinis TaxID=194519 RepID=UPI002A811C27|nr:hypothetical protein NDC12_pgp157 [Polyopes affinis]WOL36979.1 hypothetical protein [Polyopes affinis]
MSHFSRIKTSVSSLTILKKTLEDLGYQCLDNQTSVKDLYGNSQDVDLVIKNGCNNMLGFAWDGYEYNLVADLQFWNLSISVERFIDKITQQYALNFVLKESDHQGFDPVEQKIMQDGSIKLILQRWY